MTRVYGITCSANFDSVHRFAISSTICFLISFVRGVSMSFSLSKSVLSMCNIGRTAEMVTYFSPGRISVKVERGK